ncbi:MAG: InlB B-repeat-containing protein, partial [Ilumatobacteraceae bacterium]
GSGSAPSSPTSVLYGSTFTTPANTYTRSGYTFAGWNDGSTTYAAGVTYPSSGTVAGPVTLTATWTATTLTVTYDSQGGSAISSGSTTVGGSISASPGTPTRTGYTFNGWFVASSGGSQIVFPYTHGQTANFTLYAQWTGNSQTISYAAGDGGSGSAPSSPTSVLYGSTFITPANTYTRSGKTFGGWSDGTNTYAAGATYPSSGTVTGNVTLTATWV